MDAGLVVSGKGLVAALLPPLGLIWLALFCLPFAFHARAGARRLVARSTLVAMLVLALMLSVPRVSDALLGHVETDAGRVLTPERARTLMQGPRPPQAIVILGGGVRRSRGDWPGGVGAKPRTVERVLGGARLARSTGLPVLLSGGSPGGLARSEAEVMGELLEKDLGISARWLEKQSRDTRENAQDSARMLADAGITRVILVTEAYHMPRALAAFRRAGLSPIPGPIGFHGGMPAESWLDWMPSASGAARSWLAMHEIVGGFWYRISGR
ncbi:MAG: YdcF family protein [Burkholderiaceae bacterium]